MGPHMASACTLSLCNDCSRPVQCNAAQLCSGTLVYADSQVFTSCNSLPKQRRVSVLGRQQGCRLISNPRTPTIPRATYLSTAVLSSVLAGAGGCEGSSHDLRRSFGASPAVPSSGLLGLGSSDVLALLKGEGRGCSSSGSILPSCSCSARFAPAALAATAAGVAGRTWALLALSGAGVSEGVGEGEARERESGGKELLRAMPAAGGWCGAGVGMEGPSVAEEVRDTASCRHAHQEGPSLLTVLLSESAP